MTDDLILHGGGRTIELAIAAWLDAKHQRSGSQLTHDIYGETLARFRAYLHARNLDLDGGITPEDRADETAAKVTALALLAQAWAGLGHPKAASFNQRLAVLSSFYKFARKQGLLRMENPIERVERAKVQRYAGAQPLDYQEVRQRIADIDRT